MVQCSTVRSDPEWRVTCPLRRGRPSVPLHTQTCLRLKQLHFLCVSEMQSKGQASVENKWSRLEWERDKEQELHTSWQQRKIDTTNDSAFVAPLARLSHSWLDDALIVEWEDTTITLHKQSWYIGGKVHPKFKFCHHLFTLSPFQMCMTYFLLQNTKEGNLKNVPVSVQ